MRCALLLTQPRVAIRGRLGNEIGADNEIGAGTILDHHRLLPNAGDAIGVPRCRFIGLFLSTMP